MKRQILKYILILSVVSTVMSCGSDDVEATVESIYLSQADELRILSDLQQIGGLFGDNSLANVSDASSNYKLINFGISETKFDSINADRLDGIGVKDTIQINSVKRIEDFVQFNVSYSGGCKEHALEVIWDGKVFTDDPCHINLILIHDAHDDNCEAWLTESYYLNLGSLMSGISYKDICDYNIYKTFNASDEPDIVIPKLSN